MARIACVDCGETASPASPKSFHNLAPGERPMWVCEDCRRERGRVARAFGPGRLS